MGSMGMPPLTGGQAGGEGMIATNDPMTSARLEAMKARCKEASKEMVIRPFSGFERHVVEDLPALAAAHEEALRLFRQLRLEAVSGGFKYDIPDQEWAKAAARIVREFEGEG